MFALLFAFFFSASSWARPDLSPGPTMGQAALGGPSTPIAPLNPDGTINWSSLVQASGELSTEAAQLQSDLETLQRRYDTLLTLSKDADQKAQAAIKAQGPKAALWRDFSLVAALSVGGALLDPQKGQGALIGAGAGAVVAVVVEAWPWLRRILRPRAAAEPKPP